MPTVPDYVVSGRRPVTGPCRHIRSPAHLDPVARVVLRERGSELVIAAVDPAVQRVRVVAAHPDQHVATGAVGGQVELVLPPPGDLPEIARGGAGDDAGLHDLEGVSVDGDHRDQLFPAWIDDGRRPGQRLDAEDLAGPVQAAAPDGAGAGPQVDHDDLAG